MDRSLEYAGKLDEEQFVDSAIYLFGHLAWAGQWRRAEPLIKGISDEQKRYQENAMLAFIAAGRGDVAGAIAFAKTLDNEPRALGNESEPSFGCRDNALLQISFCELSCRRFRGAKELLEMIHDPRGGFQRMVPAGQMPSQRRAVRRSSSQRGQGTPSKRQPAARLRPNPKTHCSVQGRSAKEPLRKDLRGLGYIESLRVMSRGWGLMDIKLDDLSEAEKRAATLKETLDKAEAWRRIAWETAAKTTRNAAIRRCRSRWRTQKLFQRNFAKR